MAALSTATKGLLGAKAAKTAAPSIPGIARFGARAAAPTTRTAFRLGKPIAKRQVRRRTREAGETARTTIETLSKVPRAARQMGLVEAPPEKKTAPRVLMGVLIGAGVTLLVEHRGKLMSLAGR